MEQRRRRRPAPSTPWAPDSGSKTARTPSFSHKIPSRSWWDPLAESVYSTLRVKPDIETVPLSPVQRRAFSSSIVPGNLDLIDCLPSCSLLHLVDHVIEFDRADITTEEHALSLNLFPVVAPCCLADRAAFLSYFQTVYSSPNGPSNTGRNSQSTEETSPVHLPYSHTTWRISRPSPRLVPSALHPPRTPPARTPSPPSISPRSSISRDQNIQCSHLHPSASGSRSTPDHASQPSPRPSDHLDIYYPRHGSPPSYPPTAPSETLLSDLDPKSPPSSTTTHNCSADPSPRHRIPC